MAAFFPEVQRQVGYGEQNDFKFPILIAKESAPNRVLRG
jgi:hypothetical protein